MGLTKFLRNKDNLFFVVYKIAIHTGDNWNAGTGDYVRVRIYGRDGYVSDKYNGFGPRFERNG